MTDERIQRLTELARRVWPYERDRLRIEIDVVGTLRILEKGSDDPLFLLDDVPPECALDALEAALLVLAEDVTIRGVRGAVLVPMLPGEPPAWAEQLASEWEAKANKWLALPHGDDHECEDACHAEATQVLRCAAELRERAREAGRG